MCGLHLRIPYRRYMKVGFVEMEFAKHPLFSLVSSGRCCTSHGFYDYSSVSSERNLFLNSIF